MVERRKELMGALAAIERTALDKLVAQGREEDYLALRQLVEEDSTPRNLRLRALHAIGLWPRLGEDDKIDILTTAFPELDEIQRVAVVNVLGRIGGSRVQSMLLQYLRDPAADVRRQVVVGLGRLATHTATQALQRVAAEDGVDYVRDLARELLR